MRIITPASLLSAAGSVRDGVTDLVLDLPGAVGDVLDLLTRARELVDRADALMTQAEDLLARGQAAVGSVETMLEDGEAMLDRTAGVLADAEDASAAATATVVAVQEVTREAAVTVEGAQGTAVAAAGLLARGETMLAPLEPIAAKATPLASRFVDEVDKQEVTALIRMVDRLPVLLGHLEDDVLPMLGKLDQVGPDVHEILETVHELTTAISGLPGASFLKRRGERKEEEGESPGSPGVPRI